MSRSFTVKAVVIGRQDFKETDKFVDLMTEYYGKLRGIAKGVRKINSKRLGSLELANLVKVLLYRGKTFYIITEVENLDNNLDFRQEESKLGSMMYVCELTNHLAPEEQENRQVYQRLLKVRNEIKQGNLSGVVTFEADLLKILGYGVKSSTKKLLAKNDFRQAHSELKIRIEEIIEHQLTSLKIFK